MYATKIAEIEVLIRHQDDWREGCINLIASENVMSTRARAAAGSDFAHRFPLSPDGYHIDVENAAYLIEKLRPKLIVLGKSLFLLNMNMLPHEPLHRHDHPDGIRIGVQEMTRFGMGTAEMERIAELIFEGVHGANGLREEVRRFRAAFRQVRYCFDAAP